MAAENEHRAMSLLDLPNEVLGVVCSQLCIHCQLIQSADIDQETTATALQGQQALARLSRCSKLLKQIAQPVLFHFFCSERPPLDYRQNTVSFGSDLEGQIILYTRAVNQLSSFAHTVLQRPELKTKVRVLTLYTATKPDPMAEHKRLDGIFESQHAVISSLYLEALEGACGALVDAARRIQSPHEDLKDLQDLQDLALAVCRSTLEDLLLERTVWRCEWGYELPRLTRLSLTGCYRSPPLTCGIKSAQYFLHHAPSLRVFVAPDCFSAWEPQPWDQPAWDVVMLSCLTRLSVTGGVDISELVEILRCCPALEELEYIDLTSWSPEPAIRLGLDVVRDTIRRLCFSSSYSLYTIDENDNWRRNTLDQMNLSSYPRLEVLEIDRCSLFGDNRSTNGGWDGNIGDEDNAGQDDTAHSGISLDPEGHPRNFYTATTAEKFLRILPPALRVLRVGFVRCWPAMYRDALALATQAPERFPHLRDVSIIVAREAPEDDVRALISLFSTSGIVASVGLAEMYEGLLSQGLLPPRPGMTGKETRESKLGLSCRRADYRRFRD